MTPPQDILGLRPQIKDNAALLFNKPQNTIIIATTMQIFQNAAGYGTMITNGLDFPTNIFALTTPVAHSAKEALSGLLTMLADGLMVKFLRQPAMWKFVRGHKYVTHGLGEYSACTLDWLEDANEMTPAALVLSR